MIEEFLNEIGLSEKEVAIYTYLLKVDQANIVDIGRNTEINRTTIYPVLEQLKKKGFVEEIEVKEKPFFKATTPDYVETYLGEQRIRIEEQTARAKDIIPQMKGFMRQGGEKPIIEYYPDRQGIINSVRSMFNLEEVDDHTAYLMYPKDIIEKKFAPSELTSIKKNRVANKIVAKSIYVSDIESLKSDDMSERYFLDAKQFPITSDITVYGDRVRVQVLGDSMGSLMIKSKDFADTMKVLFKLAIKGLKKSE